MAEMFRQPVRASIDLRQRRPPANRQPIIPQQELRRRILRNTAEGLFSDENYDRAAERAHMVGQINYDQPRGILKVKDDRGIGTQYTLAPEVTRAYKNFQDGIEPPLRYVDYHVTDGIARTLSDGERYMPHSYEAALDALDRMNASPFLRLHKIFISHGFEHWSSARYQRSLLTVLNGLDEDKKPLFQDARGRWLPAIDAKLIVVFDDVDIGEGPSIPVVDIYGSQLSDIDRSQGGALRWIFTNSADDRRLANQDIRHKVVARVLLRLNDLAVYAHEEVSFGTRQGRDCCWVLGNVIGVALKPTGQGTTYYRAGAQAKEYEWIVLYGARQETYCLYGIFSLLLMTGIAQKGWRNLHHCAPLNLDLKLGWGVTFSNSMSVFGKDFPGRIWKWASAMVEVSYRSRNAAQEPGRFRLLHRCVRRSIQVRKSKSGYHLVYYYNLHLSRRFGGSPEHRQRTFYLGNVRIRNRDFQEEGAIMELTRLSKDERFDLHVRFTDLHPFTKTMEEFERM